MSGERPNYASMFNLGQELVFGGWQGYENRFRIDTPKPSQVLMTAVESGFIHTGDSIVDIGCGKNPRNAIYLATHHSAQVDAIDLEPVQLPSDIPQTIVDRMKFHTGSVMDFDYGQVKYQAAIMTRIAQYVPGDDLKLLMQKVHKSLSPKGIVAFNYTAAGGILTKQANYGIETFSHDIEEMSDMFRSLGFNLKHLTRGASQSTHVPHAGESALTYDLIAQK